jgi:ABC-type uncharacterized transport system permease subunit
MGSGSVKFAALRPIEVTNERELIALAAIFSANGNPYWAAAVTLVFGTATALSVRLPRATGAAPQLLQLIPYVVTVLALVAVGCAIRARATDTALGASSCESFPAV